jgi:hypothetical protein
MKAIGFIWAPQAGQVRGSGVTVKGIVPDHHLSLIGDMGCNHGNEVQVVHLHPVGITVSVLVYDLTLLLVE